MRRSLVIAIRYINDAIHLSNQEMHMVVTFYEIIEKRKLFLIQEYQPMVQKMKKKSKSPG